MRYTFGGHDVILSHWHRPLNVITTAFTQAGFRITGSSEPPAAPGAAELFPEAPAAHPSGAFICFLFFVLEAA